MIIMGFCIESISGSTYAVGCAVLDLETSGCVAFADTTSSLVLNLNMSRVWMVSLSLVVN